ncbi:DNA-binding transcriptional LysR family regulator [Sphingobium sp. B8D3D]|nr:DNA-binding transcriptional LysR family regulator [Sphingobium sp. B8D3D]MCW2416976.1 DNA-binding transcriptional LysR family regulator [Sphingobium sp. B8D3A]
MVINLCAEDTNLALDRAHENRDKVGCSIAVIGTMKRHSLTELDAVVAIVRRGSFRAAAIDLGTSTSALSNAIGKLERQLGVRLFNRTTRSVSLTDAGHTFVARMGPALQEIHEAMEAVRSQQDVPSGTLRINAFPTAAREIMVPLVLPFLRRYPQVHIDLVTEGRLVDIVGEGFDLGVRSADLVPSDMIAVPLGASRHFAVVATPDYFEKQGKPQVPADLHSHQCLRVRLPNGALFRWHFEKNGQSVQLDVKGPITLDEASLSRTAVLNGVGIGFFMESDVRKELADGRLVQVLQDWTSPIAPLALYYPSRRNPSAAFKAFVDLARKCAHDL